MPSDNWVRIPVVAGFVVLCGANIVGNIISAEKRCNYPGRRHLPTQHFRQSICSGLCPSTATREVARTADAPLYITFIDLSKAFYLVGRDGLFEVLPKIGCPTKLQSMIASFHGDTKGTVQFSGSSSEPFEIRSQ